MAGVPAGTSIVDLFTKVMPQLSKEALEASGKAAELAGTEVTMAIETSDAKFAFTIKDGVDVNVSEGDIDAPNIRMNISTADLEKMIANQELDMLLGMSSDLNVSKVEAIKLLSGTMNVVLTNDDGSSYAISTKFNGADAPACTMTMKTSDSTAIMTKEANPVSLFMAGAIQMDGDMGFAMGFQPLVT